MKKIKIFTALFLSAALFCFCGKASAELPEDNPANHGRSPIMETDKGYFSNSGYMFIRYYEKNSDNELFLCAKPECMHVGGDGCTATYKGLDVINTVFYDNFLYIYTAGEEDKTISLSLYKAAADGTSITKVGDVFTVENFAGEKYGYSTDNFIIHKGQAYLPYHVNLGDSTFGFAGSGLVKMDIFTGKTKQLESGENYFSGYPEDLQGSGNKIYYHLSDIKAHTTDMYSYNIDTEEIKKEDVYSSVIGKDCFFARTFDDDGSTGICKISKDTGEVEIIVEKIDGYERNFNYVTVGDGMLQDMMYYDGRIILTSGDKVLFYDEEGNRTGEIETASLSEGYDDYIDVYIKLAAENGRLFAKVFNSSFSTDVDCVVYSADFDDTEKGWTEEYRIKLNYVIDNERGADYVYSRNVVRTRD